MPPKVLVADDEAHIVRRLRVVLERAGYQVATAAGGREALEKVREELPDLIVLDIMMPWMDGLEVVRALKAAPATSQIPLIMLSGRFADMSPYPPHGEWTRYFQPSPAAPDYLFVKPFDPAELLPVLGGYLEGKRLGRPVPDAVPEAALDYEEILRRGGANCGDEDFALGANCGDEDFALCKGPHCGRVYLIEHEVDTLYPDPANLDRRISINLGVSGYQCEGCRGELPERTAWIGPEAPGAMQVRWRDAGEMAGPRRQPLALGSCWDTG
jgi:two-component system, OmpR family, alkaline phosphatase synthesis response regulator PhoP